MTDVRSHSVKAGLYARVSKAEQTSRNQISELRDYCTRQGWEIHHEYVDEDVRGSDPKPELERLLRDAHERRFDVMLAWSLDRVSRRGAQDALDLLDRLHAANVDYVFLKEPYLSSLGPWKDAVVAIIATIAKLESTRISERIRAGLARARREGARLGRPPRDPPKDLGAFVQDRRRGLSWAQLGEKYGLPRASARRLYQKACKETEAGNGRDLG